MLPERTPMLAFSFPGGSEWIIILIVALLVFGPRLPSVMRSLGRSINEFKKGLKETEDEVDRTGGDPSKKELKG